MERTADQILSEYKDKLGPEFGSLFFHAHNEWCELWVTWKQFENLFGHGPERVDLMNRAGASFFYRVDRYFFEAVMLAICRLSDRPKTAGKSNLTVMRFHEFMDSPVRRQRLEEMLKEVSAVSEFARDWRDRHISHNDYELKVGRADPLRDATRNAMNIAIEALHQVFSYVSREFMQSHLHKEVVDELNNEMVMLDRLFRGDMAFHRECESARNGDRQTRLVAPPWLRSSIR